MHIIKVSMREKGAHVVLLGGNRGQGGERSGGKGCGRPGGLQLLKVLVDGLRRAARALYAIRSRVHHLRMHQQPSDAMPRHVAAEQGNRSRLPGRAGANPKRWIVSAFIYSPLFLSFFLSFQEGLIARYRSMQAIFHLQSTSHSACHPESWGGTSAEQAAQDPTS